MRNRLPKQLSAPRYQSPPFIQPKLRLKRRMLTVFIYGVLSIVALNLLRGVGTLLLFTTPSGSDLSYIVGYVIFYVLILLSLGLSMLTIAAISSFTQGVVTTIRQRQILITCPACTTLNPVNRYVEGKGCKACGAHLVYCERCGKAIDFVHFFPGKGCPSCGHRYFHTK
jgi:hypothetical protein